MAEGHAASSASHAYADNGRFSTISATVGSESNFWTYSYLANSDLISGLTEAGSGVTIARSFEAKRNLIAQVENKAGTNVISKYQYANDQLARRTQRKDSGTAVGTLVTNDFGYNTRSEVISGLMGTNVYGYVFDNIGNRTNSTWSATATNLFVYDGWNLIAEHNHPSTGSGSSTNHYAWGLDLSGSLQGAGGIGGLLSRTRSSDTQTVFYCYDANGNVAQLLDASDATNVLASYEYKLFGGILSITGTEASNNVYRFSTKYADDETGLYYYGLRYYSPGVGRWTSRDPIGEIGGLSLNLSSFVRNLPVQVVDPLGLKGFCCWWKTKPTPTPKPKCECPPPSAKRRSAKGIWREQLRISGRFES